MDSSAQKKKKKGGEENPKKDYFPWQRKQLRANFKNKKKKGVKFVLEKFLNENAIRKKKSFLKTNDKKHAFFAVGKVLTILLL